MKFFLGFITALLLVVIAAAIFAVTYNVAASVPEKTVESAILHAVMQNSVRSHAGVEGREKWSSEELRTGFKDYNDMCIICHSARGKERKAISKSMRPEPPNLAETSKRWTPKQLFWIVKNGIKMTGMPAFGPTHDDQQIWNIVGFVRLLPEMPADTFREMKVEYEGVGESEEQGHHP